MPGRERRLPFARYRLARERIRARRGGADVLGPDTVKSPENPPVLPGSAGIGGSGGDSEWPDAGGGNGTSPPPLPPLPPVITGPNISFPLPPVFTLGLTNPEDQTVLEGNTATFQSFIVRPPEPDPPITLQWEMRTNGGTTVVPVGSTTESYTTPPATEADDGNMYRLVGTGPHNTAVSAWATLNVRTIEYFIPNSLCFAFIDESEPGYYDSQINFETDLADYRNLIENAGNIISSGLISPKGHIVVRGWEFCIPSTYSSPPPEFPAINVGRPPTLTDLQNHFHLVKANALAQDATFQANKILLVVDNSGSMETGTIEPTYSQFKAWLASEEPDADIVEQQFFNELWVSLFANFIRDLAPEQP
jgi:hypothetical protein